MEIIKISSKTADIRLSNSELKTLINALSEVCNVLFVSEFKTRMGVSREETIALSESIIRLLETQAHNSSNSK